MNAAAPVAMSSSPGPQKDICKLATREPKRKTWARKLAAKPLSSLIETKRLLKGAQTPAVLERMQQEGAIFRRMLTEPAAKEAFGAFLQKRKPDFSKL